MPSSTAQLEHLRSAIADDPDPTHRLAHATTLDFVERAVRAERAGQGRYPEAWALFPGVAAAQAGEPGWALLVGVLASLVGVAHLAEAEDFLAVSRLAKRYGHRKIASSQNVADDLLGTGPGMPLASRAVQATSLTGWIHDLVRDATSDAGLATEVAERNYQAGFWLVMTDVDPDRPGPVLTTAEEVAQLWDHGGLPAWRGQIALIAANPWAPYGTRLQELAKDADRTAPLHAFEECVKIYRTRFERRERELVAREIRELVALSGLSQREFAAMVGTSASRLSTYVNGLVTPSATLMLRIRRVSGVLSGQRT